MNGQLYQSCYCGNSPVCAMCEYCDVCCTCPSEIEQAKILKKQSVTLKLKSQFNIIKGYIEGFAEKQHYLEFGDGEVVFDNTRHGVGYEVKIDDQDNIHMTHSTGSRVDEWSFIQYSLKSYDDEGFSNSNKHIKIALQKLSKNQILNDSEIDPFKY